MGERDIWLGQTEKITQRLPTLFDLVHKQLFFGDVSYNFGVPCIAIIYRGLFTLLKGFEDI